MQTPPCVIDSFCSENIYNELKTIMRNTFLTFLFAFCGLLGFAVVHPNHHYVNGYFSGDGAYAHGYCRANLDWGEYGTDYFSSQRISYD